MDDHEYDAELAANISSEPESSDQEHADQDNRQSADNTLKSNECDREDSGLSADEVGDSWWKRLHFSYFTFSKEVMLWKPEHNENISGECIRCKQTCKGQLQSTTNWLRHIKVIYNLVKIQRGLTCINHAAVLLFRNTKICTTAT